VFTESNGKKKREKLHLPQCCSFPLLSRAFPSCSSRELKRRSCCCGM